MKVISKRIQIKTSKSVEIKNFTPEVIDFIRESDVNNGFLLVHTRHTTTGLILNENENRLIKDIENTLLKLVPKGAGYKHDQIDDNAHSHIIAALIGNSLSIPIINGSAELGSWQSILFIELDGPRSRTVVLQVISD